MEKVKVVKIDNEEVIFSDGTRLVSSHDDDCCESHYLDFNHVDIADFEELEFDLTNDDFFTRIEDYGIELNPIHGHSIKIPGYGSNNGYYGDNIDLIIIGCQGEEVKRYDVSECQDVNWE